MLTEGFIWKKLKIKFDFFFFRKTMFALSFASGLLIAVIDGSLLELFKPNRNHIYKGATIL
jgi:hypothetical protein